MKIRILLPAYNEELSLPPLLARIERTKEQFGLDLDVLVVNDGSEDNTLSIARNHKGNLPVNVFDQQPNQGLAQAFRTGFREALNDLEDDDILVTMDADDSHDPRFVADMIPKIIAGADLVIASRFQRGAEVHGLNVLRKLISWSAGYLFRLFTPVKNVRDFTCGFRAMKVSAVKRTISKFGNSFIEEQGFSCSPEILLKMARLGCRCDEIPFVLRYDLKQGKSKMKVGKTIRQSLALIQRERKWRRGNR